MKIVIPFFLLLSSCTYSIIMNHTGGEASDVVDQNQTPTSTVNPDISVMPTI